MVHFRLETKIVGPEMTQSVRSSGFTLIELLVTMALAAILLTVTAPELQKLLANQRLSSSASNFMTSVMQTRSAALKYNQRVVAQPIAGSGGEWKDGWRIYVDADLNSTFNAGTDTLVLTQEALPDNIAISLSTGPNNFFGYKGSGFLEDAISGSANSTWLISSSATDRRKYLIMERSGRARLCDPVLTSPCP